MKYIVFVVLLTFSAAQRADKPKSESAKPRFFCREGTCVKALVSEAELGLHHALKQYGCVREDGSHVKREGMRVIYGGQYRGLPRYRGQDHEMEHLKTLGFAEVEICT